MSAVSVCAVIQHNAVENAKFELAPVNPPRGFGEEYFRTDGKGRYMMHMSMYSTSKVLYITVHFK